MAKQHPYVDYEQTVLWKIIQKALRELSDNKDLEITTKEEYVIGFICKAIGESDLLRSWENDR